MRLIVVWQLWTDTDLLLHDVIIQWIRGKCKALAAFINGGRRTRLLKNTVYFPSLDTLPGSNVLPKILPFWCKNGGVICLWGVNWCKSVGVICSEGVKWCRSGLQWAAMGGLLRNYPPWLKLPWKSGLQWAAMGGVFRNYPPWPKLPCKSGLQWAAMGGLFRNYPPPWLKLQCKSGLQWEEFSGITPHDWNCHVRVGCNGLQWEDF